MSRFRLVAVIAAVAAMSLSLLPSVANADHSWGNYHWARTSDSFTLQTIDSVSTEWQDEFGKAVADWNLSSKLDLAPVAGDDDNKTRKRCQATAGQIRVCNASYGQNGWLGLASISVDSNRHITQGVAKMNDSYDWYFASKPGEKQHVMCQEIGHLFGLGHTSEDGSSQSTCMDYSDSLNSISPNDHDYGQLVTIYGHIDSYDSYASGTSGGGGDGGDGGGGDKPCRGPSWKCNGSGSPNDFGQLVASSEHHQLWMKRGPAGSMTLTHLYLAPRR